MAADNPLEENKHIIGTKFDYLKSCDDYTTKDAVNAINFLRNMFWSLGPNKDKNYLCSELTEFMLKQGLVLLVVKMVRSLTGATDEGGFEARRELGKTIFNIACVLKSTVAMPIRLELIKNGMIRALLDDLEACDPNTKNPRQRIRIIDDLFRLQNVILTPGSIPYYREAGAVDALMRYVQGDHEITKIFSLRVLACIVNEEESQRLSGSGVMEPMIDMLRKASQSPDNKYQYEFVVKIDDDNERGFRTTLKTLTEGIVNLSSNDANKYTIVAYGGIPVLASILRAAYTDNQKYAATEALYKLAFQESICDIILNHLTVSDAIALQTLQAMRYSATPNLRDVSKGLLHQLDLLDIHKEPSEEEKTVETLPSDEGTIDGPHIMISYQWDHQDKALTLRNKLRAKGYNVWMDVDKMEGNILMAMANAVENAEVVLMCVSRSYKASANCQTEANYSYRLKKATIPVMVEKDYDGDGWLGALIAMKLYTRAFSDEMLEKDMAALIRELGNRGRKV